MVQPGDGIPPPPEVLEPIVRDTADAVAEYDRPLALVGNAAERTFLQRRRDEFSAPARSEQA